MQELVFISTLTECLLSNHNAVDDLQVSWKSAAVKYGMRNYFFFFGAKQNNSLGG